MLRSIRKVVQLVRLIRDHDVGHKPLLRRRPGKSAALARLLVLRAALHAPARFNVGPRTPIPLRVTAQSLGPYGTNCFVVSSAGTGEALVIDPGAEPDRIRRSLEADGLRCVAILVTPVLYLVHGAINRYLGEHTAEQMIEATASTERADDASVREHH